MPEEQAFAKCAQEAMRRHEAFCGALLNNRGEDAEKEIRAAQRRMSDHGAALRNPGTMIALQGKTRTLLSHLAETVSVPGREKLYLAYKLRDILLCQDACLTAMIDFAAKIGGARGSALYLEAGAEMGKILRFRLAEGQGNDQVQEIRWGVNGCTASWRPVRPLPQDEDFFENVWRAYRENQNIF